MFTKKPVTKSNRLKWQETNSTARFVDFTKWKLPILT